MDMLTSNTMLMMEKSMDYLWAKQTAVLDNISNAETPGYKTKFVTFEETFRSRLASAMKESNPRESVREALEQSKPILRVAKQDVKRMDGNGVNVTEQSVELVRNGYQMQYVMEAINKNFSILRTAIRGQ